MSVAAELHDLQEVDLALDRHRARLQEIEDAIQESEELVQARQLKEEASQVVAGLRSRQTELEWDVDDVRSKASAVEASYGGSVRNPKELSDLDTDLKLLKGQASKREDVLLALMEEVDAADAESQTAQATYSQLEADWRANCDQLLEEKAGLEPEVERLELQRRDVANAIDRAALNLYQVLRERRGGQAIVRVERGMCQGCRITLPMSVLQKTRIGLGLVQCVSCERILLVS
jgi:predicted  nucleic acid-binding Zn-ribbon protein